MGKQRKAAASVVIGVRLSAAERKALGRFAKRTGRTLSGWLREQVRTAMGGK